MKNSKLIIEIFYSCLVITKIVSFGVSISVRLHFLIMKTVFTSDPKVISAHLPLDQVCKVSYSQRTRFSVGYGREGELNFDMSQ